MFDLKKAFQLKRINKFTISKKHISISWCDLDEQIDTALMCSAINLWININGKTSGINVFRLMFLKRKKIYVIERLHSTRRVSANTDRCCNFSFCPYNSKPLAGIGSHSGVLNQQKEFTCRPTAFPSRQRARTDQWSTAGHRRVGTAGFYTCNLRHLELILLNGWGGNRSETHSDT